MLEPKPGRRRNGSAEHNQPHSANCSGAGRLLGIGRWAAEMFLIFHLLRLEVLPVADTGIQREIARHYNDCARLSPDELFVIAEPWWPWRSLGSWYLWRSLDAIPVEY